MAWGGIVSLTFALMNRSNVYPCAAGEGKYDLAAELAAHVQQLTESTHSRYAQHQETTAHPTLAGCHAPNGALMR